MQDLSTLLTPRAGATGGLPVAHNSTAPQHQFRALDATYWESVFFTCAATTTAFVFAAFLVLVLVSCARCCCHRTSKAEAPCRFRTLVGLHLLCLLGTAMVTYAPWWGSALCGDGLHTVTTTFDEAASNFSSADDAIAVPHPPRAHFSSPLLQAV